MTTPKQGKADRPSVTMKLATSLDGRIATRTGESQWITCAESRAQTHHLRAAHDAIIVGVGTVLADDPMLTARTDPPQQVQPLRLVADSNLRTPLDSKLVLSARETPLALCVGVDVDDARFDDYLRKGVMIWETQIAPMGGVSVGGILSRCAEEGVESLFVEGGGQLAASFLKASAVDRIEWFRAPVLLGSDALASTASLGIDQLDEALRFKRLEVKTTGSDIWETYVFDREKEN